MSGDLISRKEAIDALYGSIFCADAIPIIEELPTAYDVEAVVRELEAKSTFFAHEAEEDKDIGHAYLATRKYGISDGLDIAIEIVRGGRNE